MASEDVARVHREAIIVEGHRDMFEMNHLAAKGQQYPVLNVTLPRLKRANISTTFYAISGDSLTHANGTYRFLHAALQNIDGHPCVVGVCGGPGLGGPGLEQRGYL